MAKYLVCHTEGFFYEDDEMLEGVQFCTKGEYYQVLDVNEMSYMFINDEEFEHYLRFDGKVPEDDYKNWFDLVEVDDEDMDLRDKVVGLIVDIKLERDTNSNRLEKSTYNNVIWRLEQLL